MPSNLPARMSGGLPVPRPIQATRVTRAVSRYEVEGFVASEKERIDQICFIDGATHAFALGSQFVDLVRSSAGDDSAKIRLGSELLAAFSERSSNALIKRYGGIR